MKKRKLAFLFAAITLLLSACGSKNTGMERDVTDVTETIAAESTTSSETAETDKLPLYVEDGTCERGNICVFGKCQKKRDKIRMSVDDFNKICSILSLTSFGGRLQANRGFSFVT